MGVFQLLSWRFPLNTDWAEPGQATCASCKGAVKLAHLILQSSHSLLQMKLKPLIWNRQKLIHGIWWVFVVFFIHFFSLLCLKQERRKLINFKSKYSRSFKKHQGAATWAACALVPEAVPSHGHLWWAVEHPQSRRAGAEGGRDFTGQRSLPTLLFGRAPGGPQCHQPFPVEAARGASRFTLRNKYTWKGIGLHTRRWRHFPVYKRSLILD